MSGCPLAVLDLIPVVEGSDARAALAHASDLARAAESYGYSRYWVAEHHLNPGVAGVSPAVTLALLGAHTRTIRLGSAATLLGHRTALSIVEEFGLLDAAFPGRIDLGLGRSGGRLPARGVPPTPATASGPRPANRHAPNGLVLPPAHSPAALLASPRFAAQQRLLHLPGAASQDYSEQVAEIVALLDGTHSAEGVEIRPVPGTGAALQLWVLGSSAGESAALAGARGLRFAANYHVAPAAVLEAVGAYREAFRPSAELDRPYVSISADVVVAEDDVSARELAAGYGPWVHSIRSAAGAIPYPSRETAARDPLTAEERVLVQDRLDTQFVGSAATVVSRLRQLQEATGADELAITTITHDHIDRVASYRLLAQAWFD